MLEGKLERMGSEWRTMEHGTRSECVEGTPEVSSAGSDSFKSVDFGPSRALPLQVETATSFSTTHTTPLATRSAVTAAWSGSNVAWTPRAHGRLGRMDAQDAQDAHDQGAQDSRDARDSEDAQAM